MNRFAGEMSEHRAELVALDTAIGDGDHGTNMNRGMTKALEKLQSAEQADPGAVLKTVAMSLVSSVGGAAGPLYGTLFLQMGGALAGEGGRTRWDAKARRADDEKQRRGRDRAQEKGGGDPRRGGGRGRGGGGGGGRRGGGGGGGGGGRGRGRRPRGCGGAPALTRGPA